MTLLVAGQKVKCSGNLSCYFTYKSPSQCSDSWDHDFWACYTDTSSSPHSRDIQNEPPWKSKKIASVNKVLSEQRMLCIFTNFRVFAHPIAGQILSRNFFLVCAFYQKMKKNSRKISVQSFWESTPKSRSTPKRWSTPWEDIQFSSKKL